MHIGVCKGVHEQLATVGKISMVDIRRLKLSGRHTPSAGGLPEHCIIAGCWRQWFAILVEMNLILKLGVDSLKLELHVVCLLTAVGWTTMLVMGDSLQGGRAKEHTRRYACGP